MGAFLVAVRARLTGRRSQHRLTTHSSACSLRRGDGGQLAGVPAET
jgi:hypothetical protein